MIVSMSDPSTDKSCREDGPLLLALLMGNNNKNTNAAAQPAPTGDQSSVIGEEGPLLFALTLGQNNNNPATNNAISNSIPDTLDPRNFGLELNPTRSNDEEAMHNHPLSNSDDDGPLLFSLILINQNKNAAAADVTPVSDTLDRKEFALELKAVGNEDEGISIASSSANDNSDDGPLLFGLLLNNQNNNNGTDPSQNNAQPCSDTLDPTNIALELKSLVEDDNMNIDNLSVNDDRDGSLLFALLLNNQNNNNNPNAPGACNNDNPKADTLDPTNIALESEPPVGTDVLNIDELPIGRSNE
ncbi:hypothetical protein OCU04_011617 [Sclerotinia nivalis]|uniref:Uncharacterized protein n=1 Tax=Sclerotinia nivalis TaxID=352851 RepID=A0A9X0ABX5_9HELO|nr:hypothetical protein OCU04_011617 [Sclerotinia nivalis]